ncbi:MAG TPA: AMP-binding protein, partial [Acidimicrobiales bacterium]|nr:AMP-binding protein [Acidimicrobiales bacterium]
MDEPSDRGVTAHARLDPDRPAMVMGETVYTYGELDGRARRLATVLGELGAGPGRPVATVLPNGIEPFEVATAAAMLGAPYLPINSHLKAAELAYILADADVAVVVGHTDLRYELSGALATPGHACGSLVVGDEYERAIEVASPLPNGDSGPGPELMFYTSGTTSRPKGVVHGNLTTDVGRHRGMQGQVDLWSWTPDDVYVMSGPAYHASHAGWALTALYIG